MKDVTQNENFMTTVVLKFLCNFCTAGHTSVTQASSPPSSSVTSFMNVSPKPTTVMKNVILALNMLLHNILGHSLTHGLKANHS